MKLIFLLFAVSILAACGDTQNNRNEEKNSAKEQPAAAAEVENIQAIKTNIHGAGRKRFRSHQENF